MPLSESSSSGFTPSQHRTWSKHVEPRMRNRLGGDYWRRYNTIEITVQSESDYFNTAIEVAKLAGGREAEFERIFEQRKKRRLEKLFDLMEDGTYQTIYERKIFPCERSRQTVSKVCSSGCLQDFLELLNGIAHGWEANALDDTTSNLSEETEKTQEPPDLYGKIQTDSYNRLATQLPPEEWYTMEKQSANATYPIGIYILEKGNNNNKAPIILRKRKSDQFTTCNSRQELESITSTTDESSTLDDNNDDNHNLVYKRRKLESSSAFKTTVINPSPQLPADNRTVKKRSGHNDCDDDCDDDCNNEQRHKRQKLDNPTACTPSQASFSAPRVTGKKVTAKKSRRRHNDSHGCSSQRKKKSSMNTTRSLRSTMSAKRTVQFWELDPSGKPHSVIVNSALGRLQRTITGPC